LVFYRRLVWLALQQEGWSPASHPQYPEQLRGAYRTVLLVAARGRRDAAQQVGCHVQRNLTL
jgi:hypothetical protein